MAGIYAKDRWLDRRFRPAPVPLLLHGAAHSPIGLCGFPQYLVAYGQFLGNSRWSSSIRSNHTLDVSHRVRSHHRWADSSKPWLGATQERGFAGIGTAKRRIENPE